MSCCVVAYVRRLRVERDGVSATICADRFGRLRQDGRVPQDSSGTVLGMGFGAGTCLLGDHGSQVARDAGIRLLDKLSGSRNCVVPP